MAINIYVPENLTLKPIITVFGVGGAGGNAVNNMILSRLEGVKFIAANTDAQSLERSLAKHKLQLGLNITKGLGAGANPDIGCQAAEETQEEIKELIKDSNMVFITAGMGGGTGTGAAPIIAKAAKEAGILTIGVVTKPFNFEGEHRMRLAEAGIKELTKYTDTLIIIPNQNLFRVANEQTTFLDAFKLADDVLYAGVRGITDLMIMPGLVNLDFADITTVMSEMGNAMMGTGEAEGENRAIKAAEAAISNPILENNSMRGARGVLINITGGHDMTLFEVDEAANRIREEADNKDVRIIFGSTFSESLSGKIRVSVVATGIGGEKIKYFDVMQQNNVKSKAHQFTQDDSNEEVLTFDDYAADSKTDSALPDATTSKQKQAGGLMSKLASLFSIEPKSKKAFTTLEEVAAEHQTSNLSNEIYDEPAILRQKASIKE